MSNDPFSEAVRQGALAALSRRVDTLRDRVRTQRMAVDKDGVEVEFLTSEGALQARLLSEFEVIARDVETMELQP